MVCEYLGIVGSEGAKFTPETEGWARGLIHSLILTREPRVIVSGGCHLGGIDLWAEEAAAEFWLDTVIHKPKNLQWSTGYKPRNLLIVRDSDEVHCITVRTIPTNYTGMRFPLCYHCGTDQHVKSGGCWTMKQAIRAGKVGELHVISS